MLGTLCDTADHGSHGLAAQEFKHLAQEKIAWEVGAYHDFIVEELRAAGLKTPT